MEKIETDIPVNFRMQAAIRQILANEEFDYSITAVFNEHKSKDYGRGTSHSIDYARAKLKHWHGLLDRNLLGQRWARKAVSERSFFMAFVEHENRNIHFHMMYRLPCAECAEVFEDWANAHWQKIVPMGDIVFQKIETEEDKIRAGNYATKDLWKRAARENFIISTEFVSAKAAL